MLPQLFSFSVSREQLVPFPGEIGIFEKRAIVALKRKKETLKAFKEDVKWAMQNVGNIVSNEEETSTLEATAPSSEVNEECIETVSSPIPTSSIDVESSIARGNVVNLVSNEEEISTLEATAPSSDVDEECIETVSSPTLTSSIDVESCIARGNVGNIVSNEEETSTLEATAPSSYLDEECMETVSSPILTSFIDVESCIARGNVGNNVSNEEETSTLEATAPSSEVDEECIETVSSPILTSSIDVEYCIARENVGNIVSNEEETSTLEATAPSSEIYEECMETVFSLILTSSIDVESCFARGNVVNIVSNEEETSALEATAPSSEVDEECMETVSSPILTSSIDVESCIARENVGSIVSNEEETSTLEATAPSSEVYEECMETVSSPILTSSIDVESCFARGNVVNIVSNEEGTSTLEATAPSSEVYEERMETVSSPILASSIDVESCIARDESEEEIIITPDMLEVVNDSDSDSDQRSTEYPDLSVFVEYGDEDFEDGVSQKIRESPKIRDKNVPDIFILKVTKSETFNGKKKKQERVQNSVHACLFCGQFKTHIQDHYQRCHPNKDEVKCLRQAYEGEINEKKKDQMNDLLRSKGDHKNNLKVKNEKKGLFILSRRPTDFFDHTLYGPCPVCYEWMLQTSLVKHQKTCKAVDPNQEQSYIPRKKHLKVMSDIEMGSIDDSVSDFLIKEVFTIMRNDEIGLLAKSDNLITCLGEKWLKDCIDNKVKRSYWSSQHMRHAARLLIELRKLDGDKSKMMSNFLRPAHFDNLVEASLNTCIPTMDDFEDLKSPSNALKIKYDIITMAERKATVANQKYDRTQDEAWKKIKKEAEGVLGDIRREWKTKVTKVARKVLNERKMHSRIVLPDPKDIQKLSGYLKEKLVTAELDENTVSWETYSELVKFAESRLLIYNRRRSGEVEGTTVKNFVHKVRTDDIDSGLIGELSVLEKHLIRTQDLIQIRGKQSRVVPMLIPEDCVRVLNFLADQTVRKKVGVKQTDKVIPAYESIKYSCADCQLKAPERITSTAMRKYMATLAQTLNLDTNQLDWICRHLGHTKTVHLTHYRQMSPFLERVSVGKVLLMQELNIQGRFSGKKLEDIDFKDMLNVNDSSDEVVEPAQTNEVVEPAHTDEVVEPAQTNLPEVAPEEDFMDETGDTVSDAESFNSDSTESSLEMNTRKARKIKKSCKRQTWTINEVKEIEVYFKDNLEKLVTPRRQMCIAAKEKSRKKGGNLQYRHWHLIVKKVSAMIQKIKKAH